MPREMELRTLDGSNVVIQSKKYIGLTQEELKHVSRALLAACEKVEVWERDRLIAEFTRDR